MKAKLALALASTLLALALFEGLARLRGKPLDPAPRYPGDLVAEIDATIDPLVGWKLPPDFELTETTDDYTVVYRSNAQGFRSRHDFARDGAVAKVGRRIVFLGDSYTFGSGVPDGQTFVERVEAALPETVAYNLGIGGYGIDQMWLSLIHYGLPLAPDLVILAFIRNDLERSLTAYRQDHILRRKPLYRLRDGALEEMTEATRPGSFHRFVVQRLWLSGLWRRIERSLARRLPVGHSWRLNRAIFARIRDDCAAAGAGLVVMHIPVNRLSPVPLFGREFAAMGIPFLDLVDHLPEEPQHLYFPSDRHLTPEGHRWVADTLLQFLAVREESIDRHRGDPHHAQGAQAVVAG